MLKASLRDQRQRIAVIYRSYFFPASVHHLHSDSSFLNCRSLISWVPLSNHLEVLLILQVSCSFEIRHSIVSPLVRSLEQFLGDLSVCNVEAKFSTNVNCTDKYPVFSICPFKSLSSPCPDVCLGLIPLASLLAISP